MEGEEILRVEGLVKKIWGIQSAQWCEPIDLRQGCYVYNRA